jgi:hypothetical protein
MLARHLQRCRIGAVRQVDCAVDPEHAAHHAAFLAFDSALQLVVEMQNALSAEHSFQLEPLPETSAQPRMARRSRYELQRGVEAHARFQRECLDVLIGNTLAALAANTVPAGELEIGWRIEVQTLQRSPQYFAARAWALELLEHFERFTDDELVVKVACCEVLDSWLLRVWKRDLSLGLRVFERVHSAASPPSDSQRVSGICARLLEHLAEYFRSASRVMGRSA